VKEILEYCDTREELKNREEEIVNEQLLTEDLCMNLKTGGQGGFSSKEHMIKAITAGGNAHAEKMKNDIEYRDKAINNLSYGRKVLIETGSYKKKGKGLGRIHSEETKNKMSESSKGIGSGKTNSQYGTCWINNGNETNKIKKEEINIWLNNGWVKGRIFKSV
jgi:hypothetical protein